MTDDNKKVETNEQDRPRGERGEVGEATAGLTIKQKYHQTYFTRVDADDKHNPNKRVWVKNEGAPTLKQFARHLAKDGDQVAKDWFAHKRGSMNAKRSDANIKAAKEAASATKAAKRKTKK